MILPNDLQETVARALAEDLGSGDVTAGLIPMGRQAVANVFCREEAVICGTAWFDEVFRQLDPAVTVEWRCQDSGRVQTDALLCSLRGSARSILSGERTALNFLQTLSATATATCRYVDLVAHTQCRILDTRKTLPGLRTAQKYAVLCGGGTNHRIGLYDRVLIKENHIMAAGSITAAIQQARKLHPNIRVEVETENLQELAEAAAAQADIIMLDDYDLAAMREAVRVIGGKIPLEASGGVSPETVTAIAETGVDFVSIGSITKHIRAVDLSMRFVK
ncbi:carboxylating nicotinate-nucleotide diphosphorylase [Candidatus Thiothrix sp. Deng01]|uniref:nicotinate-nucleotide diphosphorylase (carboxylating) n=1 Tax=Candidatus Thiothrix phosphatis TaxID=3112415 RepID=A0ABU6CWT0_9GAMM|nr:carboxylating nicotinate-nucleotide diphosphorylase [Candidatus Thiothrix sp. Deng01]MEB4590542.1 carboxylating nicotinate-nucleotide diphosphorylase [Candidatus Thiothrix sp. Deng01]